MNQLTTLASLALFPSLLAFVACSATTSDEPEPPTGAQSSSSVGGQAPSAQGSGGAGGQGGQGGESNNVGGGFGLGGGGSAPMTATDVEVVITADNAYGFGYGDATKMLNYFGGVEAQTAGQIFNCNGGPETYTVPAADAAAGDYLFIIGYADKSVTQGVLGQFRRLDTESQTYGDAVYTGQGDWSVCATNQDFNPGSGGPSLQQINAAIPNCTWYDQVGDAMGKVAYGEDNTTPYNGGPKLGNEFTVACGIDDEARWMWFNWDPNNIVWPSMSSPFLWPPGGSGNIAREFLIFRLKANDVPEPPK